VRWKRYVMKKMRDVESTQGIFISRRGSAMTLRDLVPRLLGYLR